MPKLDLVRFKDAVRFGATNRNSLKANSDKLVGPVVEMTVDPEVRVVTVLHSDHGRVKFIPVQNVIEMDILPEEQSKAIPKAVKAK